jgi:hypothetical protein
MHPGAGVTEVSRRATVRLVKQTRGFHTHTCIGAGRISGNSVETEGLVETPQGLSGSTARVRLVETPLLQ